MENKEQKVQGITITALKARELTEQNQEKNLEIIYKAIDFAIKEGRYSLSFRFGLNIKQVNELLNLGYGIRKHNDPINFDEITVISW